MKNISFSDPLIQRAIEHATDSQEGFYNYIETLVEAGHLIPEKTADGLLLKSPAMHPETLKVRKFLKANGTIDPLDEIYGPVNMAELDQDGIITIETEL